MSTPNNESRLIHDMLGDRSQMSAFIIRCWVKSMERSMIIGNAVILTT
jgi:hypothetical protein